MRSNDCNLVNRSLFSQVSEETSRQADVRACVCVCARVPSAKGTLITDNVFQMFLNPWSEGMDVCVCLCVRICVHHEGHVWIISPPSMEIR